LRSRAGINGLRQDILASPAWKTLQNVVDFYTAGLFPPGFPILARVQSGMIRQRKVEQPNSASKEVSISR